MTAAVQAAELDDMPKAFAHVAMLEMAADADLRAPGAAITVALCGHWEHPPPCPVAPHHNQAEWFNGHVRVRTLFVADPPLEAEVRRRIVEALSSGQLRGPDGVTTRWQLLSCESSAVQPRETTRAWRIAYG